MLLINLHTLAFFDMLSALVFTATTLAAWQLMPEERSLKKWAIGTALVSLGLLEVATRSVASISALIPIGNGLIVFGLGFLFLGIRELLDVTPLPHEGKLPYISAASILVTSSYCTFISQSNLARIAALATVVGLFHGGYGWLISNNRELKLAGWLKFTVAIHAVGLLLYCTRAWSSPELTSLAGTSHLPVAITTLTGLYALFVNVWMSITVVLIVSARAQNRIEETLNFNEAILVHSPLAMGVYNHVGDCAFANEAYAQLVGASSTQLLTQNFLTIPSWEKSGLRERCTQALDSGEEQQVEVHITTTFGKEVWLDCHILPARLNGRMHLLIQFFDLTERKHFENTLVQMAFHDPLTQLPNRRLLMDRINQAQLNSKRTGAYGALLFMDLDNFKPLNDQHGHGTGDLLLVELAKRLRATVRENDTVARMGGDEFVVMLEGLAEDETTACQQADSVVHKLHLAMSNPYELGALHYYGTASIGIKLFLGDADDPDQILKDADSAMYLLKHRDASPSESQAETFHSKHYY